MSYEVTNEQLIAHFKDALADAEALVQATADLGGDQLESVRARAMQSLREAKARMAETQDAVMFRARAATRATDAFVHDSPWEAMGVAAAVGVLLGVLVARR